MRCLILLYLAGRAQFFQAIQNGNVLFGVLMQPVLFALATGYVFQMTGHVELLPLAALGSGLMGLWNSNVLTSGGALQYERDSATFDLLMMSPTSPFLVILGRILCNAVMSTIALMTSFLTTRLAFGVSVAFLEPWTAAWVITCLVLAAAALGLLMATAFMVTPATRRVIEVMNYPTFILSGFLVPLSFLPKPLQVIGWGLPLTWAASALQHLAGVGTSPLPPLPSSLILLGMSALYVTLGYRLYQRIERKLRSVVVGGEQFR